MQGGPDEQDRHSFGGADPHFRQSTVAATSRQTKRLARQSPASLRSSPSIIAVTTELAVTYLRHRPPCSKRGMETMFSGPGTAAEVLQYLYDLS